MMPAMKNPLMLLALMVVFQFVALAPIPNTAQRAQRIKGRACAVLVDMQPLYLTRIDRKELKREVNYIYSTLEFCYRNGIPIVALEIEGAGDTEPDIKDELVRLGATFVRKDGNSGFEGTDLEEQLNRMDIDTVILMGVNASICVKATAEDALACGFSICTSRQLVEEPGEWRPGIKTYESVTWFMENGIYCDRYKDLLYVIANSREYSERPYKPMPIASARDLSGNGRVNG